MWDGDSYDGLGTTSPGWCGVAIAGVEIRLEHVAGRDRDGEGEVLEGVQAFLGYLRDAEKSP